VKGRVLVGTANPKMLEGYVEEDDMIIMGDREEDHLQAISQNVSCIIVGLNIVVSEKVIKLAHEKNIVIIRSPYDTFNIARLINQSIPVKQFMTREGIVSFQMDDYVDDVKDVMARRRFRDFPILDEAGNFLGFISRRRLLNSRRKQVILVDHNEKNQAVDGVEEAEVLEIIDHHRLSSIETMGPVFFRNQPVGCTATIVYQMYQEEGVEVEPVIASLLCSAIISDTLMFRSPTCTPLDERSARKLAEIAGIDIEKLALEMFNAGSNLKGKTAEEICFLDFKQFTVNDINFGVGQISSMSAEELREIKTEVSAYLEQARKTQGLDMIFFMLTNIVAESSELLCAGNGAREKMISAFDLKGNPEMIELKGVVSRKKQLVPTLVSALQQ